MNLASAPGRVMLVVQERLSCKALALRVGALRA